MIRLSSSPQDCGYVVHYGRTSCTPIFDIKAGEIQLVDVNFCSGPVSCVPCDDELSITAEPVVSVETDVLGAGPVTVDVKSYDGCTAVILVDATNATLGSRYAIRVTADMSDCRRLSDCFKIRIAGGCGGNSCMTGCGAGCGCGQGGCGSQGSGGASCVPDICDKFLGQETICTSGLAALSPPPGTVSAEIFTTSTLQYMLNGMPPSGSPAIYANMGCTIPLNSLTEIAGFRAESYCPEDQCGNPVDVSFVATYRGC